MSFRTRPLVYHLHCVNSGPIAHLPPPPCQFEPDCLYPTPTMSIRAQSLISCLHHVFSSLTARLPPPPCQLVPDRSSPSPTTSIRVHLLVSHSQCQFERNRSSPAPTTSFQAQQLVCHLHRINSSATACLPPPPYTLKRSRARTLVSHPHHVNLSATSAHVPSPPGHLEPERSCPTPTMSTQAGTLVSCTHCQFKPDHSYTTPTRSI